MTVRLPSFSKMKIPQLKRLSEMPGLVLASGSPRRQQILTECGLEFDISIPDIDEKSISGDTPERLVVLLAEKKTRAVEHDKLKAYLGCDTIVVYEGKILNKPIDQADAAQMLKILSSHTHSVFSGLALYDSQLDTCHTSVEESRVTFNEVSNAQIADYIATGEPDDKAGAYGIQGMGRFLVDTVVGNIDNVIGLPVAALERIAGQYLEKYV